MDKPSIAHSELVAARLKRVAGLRESQRELPRQPGTPTAVPVACETPHRRRSLASESVGQVQTWTRVRLTAFRKDLREQVWSSSMSTLIGR